MNIPRKLAKIQAKTLSFSNEVVGTTSKQSKTEQNEIEKLFSHHRALIFSMSLAGGLLILLALRDANVAGGVFWLLSAIIFTLLVVETITTYAYAKRKANHIDLPHIPDNTLRPHFYYHMILPTLLYLGATVYVYLDFNTVIDLILIALITVTYYSFLRNVRATYENDFKTEEWSIHALDAANIIIYFTIAGAVAEAAIHFDWKPIGITFVLALSFFAFMLLTLWKRLEVSPRGILTAFVLSVFQGVIGWLSIKYLPSMNSPLCAGAWWSLIYYLLSAVFIHKLEGTLKLGIFVEYLLIATVAMFLLSQV